MILKQSKGDLTRQTIKQALLRLQNNRPKVVTPGRKISIAAVAEEAGVSRATIHNNYPEIAKRIREMNNNSSRVQLDEKHQNLNILKNKNRELRDQIQNLNSDLAKITSINASLLLENTMLQTIINNKKVSLIKN
ncbi:TPA: TetR/AcrR family transcriptional regulator [Legionella pneumophila]|nr:TetR/AcrR family transcriptional regulator [Legionella pneumophila]